MRSVAQRATAIPPQQLVWSGGGAGSQRSAADPRRHASRGSRSARRRSGPLGPLRVRAGCGSKRPKPQHPSRTAQGTARGGQHDVEARIRWRTSSGVAVARLAITRPCICPGTSDARWCRARRGEVRRGHSPIRRVVASKTSRRPPGPSRRREGAAAPRGRPPHEQDQVGALPARDDPVEARPPGIVAGQPGDHEPVARPEEPATRRHRSDRPQRDLLEVNGRSPPTTPSVCGTPRSGVGGACRAGGRSAPAARATTSPGASWPAAAAPEAAIRRPPSGSSRRSS